jgi:hypothetical protein
MRVKLENQAQDYEDKLFDQKSMPQTDGQTPQQPTRSGTGQAASLQAAQQTPHQSSKQ